MTIKKNIEITVDSKTRWIDFHDNFAGIKGENLQGYIIFKFKDNFVSGVPRVNVEQNGQTYSISEVETENETYKMLIKSSLLTSNEIKLELIITEPQDQNGIPIFKSKIFTLMVADSIEANEPIPEQYDTWMDIANQKIIDINNAIAEVENLNITAERVSDGVEINITDKEGHVDTKKVNDGEKGDTGETGATGITPNIHIGTIESGESPSVTRTGTNEDPYLNFVLEKGDRGDSGLVAFRLNEDGHLIAISTDPYNYENYSIRQDGHLYIELEESE